VADAGGNPDPLQRLSTRKVYVVTRSTFGRPTHRRDRQLADPVGDMIVTKVNEIAAGRISARRCRLLLVKPSGLGSAAIDAVPVAACSSAAVTP